MKKKKIVIVFIVLVFIGMICVVHASKKEDKNPLTSIKKDRTLEFGQPLSQKAEDYLDVTLEEPELFKVIGDSQLSFNLGTHPIRLSYKNEKKTIGLYVKDTTQPYFDKFEENLTFKVGEKKDLTELEKYFRGKDKVGSQLREASVSFEGYINFDIEGDYLITVIIKDENGLKTERKTNVKIIGGSNKIQNSINSSNSTKKEINNSPAMSIVSRTITITPLSKLNPLNTVNFGKYQKLAEHCYQYLSNGKKQGHIDVLFDSEKEIENFITKFDSHIFAANKKLPANKRLTIKDSVSSSCIIEGEPINVTFDLNDINTTEFFKYKEIDKWISSRISQGMKDTQIVETLNDFLRDKTTYDYSYQTISYQALGLVRNNKAVCAGYAELFQLACASAGIEAKYISGIAINETSQKHAWNRVKLGNTWYYIDTCWNADLKTNRYYLSEKLWDTHKI